MPRVPRLVLFDVFDFAWNIITFLLFIGGVIYAVYLAIITRESFASSWMMTLHLDNSTSYHQSEAEIVAADPYLRSITSGTKTGYSSLANPKYAYIDSATGSSMTATNYAGLPASATYSSSGTSYVPDYTDAIALSRTR